MDKIAHLLENMKTVVNEETDPSIEINTGKFSHGGTKLINNYLDNDNKFVSKSEATIIQSYEFDESGKVLYSDTKKLL